MEHSLTELVMILDRSGSMAGLEKDTIGGFNSLIERQKKETGTALVTTVLFDHQRRLLYDRVPLEQVPAMTERDYYAGGSTALLDAVGSTVSRIRNLQNTMPEAERPEKTICVITTDGMENASREYTWKGVQTMISDLQKQDWEFLFLGANMDAARVGGEMGVRKDHSATYCCDEAGTALNYQVLGEAVSCARRQRAPLQADWKRRIDRDLARRKNTK